jgi:hypothetical protein
MITEFSDTATYLQLPSRHHPFDHWFSDSPLRFVRGDAEDFGKAGNARRTAWRHFAVAFVAIATHPVLDWMNAYGVRPWLPFNTKWYYGDTLYVLELFLDWLLLIGVMVSFKLIHQKQRVARFTLLIVVLFIGARLGLRELAETRLAAYNRNVSGFVRSALEATTAHPPHLDRIC